MLLSALSTRDTYTLLTLLAYLLLFFGGPILVFVALAAIVKNITSKTQPNTSNPSSPLENLLIVLSLVVAVVAFVFYGLIEIQNWLTDKWKNRF